MVYLACAPTESWAARMICWHVGLMYLGSALCKSLTSAVYGSWVSRHTLQSYLFDVMASRPAVHPLLWAARAGFASRPGSLGLLGSLGAYLFELGFSPLLALQAADPSWRVGPALAAAGLLFHTGAGVLLDMDFVTYWCPALLALLRLEPEPAAAEAWGWREGLSLAYLSGQLYVALTLWDLRKHEEAIPFSCCPMFVVKRHVFDDWGRLLVVAAAGELCGAAAPAGDVHALEAAEDLQMARTHGWPLEPTLLSPVIKGICEVKEAELNLLPYKVVMFGHCVSLPKEALQYDVVNLCYLGKEFLLFSNVQLEEPLVERLRRFVAKLRSSPGWQPVAGEQMLHLLEELRALRHDVTLALQSAPRLRYTVDE